MKITAVSKILGRVDRASARIGSWWCHGFVRVVSIECRQCGLWVDASDWDPQYAVCDECTRRLFRRVARANRSARIRAGRAGGAQ